MRIRNKRSGNGTANGRRWMVGAMAALMVMGAVAGVSAGAMKKDPGAVGSDGHLNKGAMSSDLISFKLNSANPTSDWIEVLSWSWGETPGRGVNQQGEEYIWPTMTDFHFTKHLDTYSPQFGYFVANDRKLDEVTFVEVVRDSHATETKYLEIKMSNAHISSYQVGGHSSSNEMPIEEMSVHFDNIEFNYIGPYSPDATGFECSLSHQGCGFMS